MCRSAMNLGKTQIGHIFKNSNKMGKVDNADIKVKFISMLKIKITLKKIFSHFTLRKKNQKPCNFFLI